MRFFRILGRSIRDAFRSVIRNFSLSFASITCITITLVIVSVSLLISYNVNNATKELKEDLSIVVFISNEADEFDIDSLETQIKSIENVDTKNVKYKSKADIKEEMMGSNETFENIMKDWDNEENPLQNTYIVKVIDADQIEKTANKIKELSNVTLVKYGEGMVQTLLMAFNGVEKASFVAVIALVVVAIFLIVNTIKLTIFSRKKELEIMRLVGASNFSIKLPFLFEGILIGLIGSIIPVVLTIYGYNYVYTSLNGKLLSDLLDLIKPNVLIVKTSVYVALIGMVVGMIGSLGAVRKYLKV